VKDARPHPGPGWGEGEPTLELNRYANFVGYALNKYTATRLWPPPHPHRRKRRGVALDVLQRDYPRRPPNRHLGQ